MFLDTVDGTKINLVRNNSDLPCMHQRQPLKMCEIEFGSTAVLILSTGIKHLNIMN
jgi:hypothetical protein